MATGGTSKGTKTPRGGRALVSSLYVPKKSERVGITIGTPAKKQPASAKTGRSADGWPTELPPLPRELGGLSPKGKRVARVMAAEAAGKKKK